MKLLSKKKTLILISITAFLCGCLHYEEPEPSGFTPDAQVYVDRILKENKAEKYVIDIVDVDVSYGFSSPRGYHLGLVTKNQIVLTNTIDSLRLHGIYRFDQTSYGHGGGLVDLPFMGISAKCDTLDSIEIITDSVIIMQDLGLGYSNLTHLSPEIGKVRVNSLDISNNQIKDLPLEIMSIFSHLKNNSGTIDISSNPIDRSYWDSIPDTLRNWLREH